MQHFGLLRCIYNRTAVGCAVGKDISVMYWNKLRAAAAAFAIFLTLGLLTGCHGRSQPNVTDPPTETTVPETQPTTKPSVPATVPTTAPTTAPTTVPTTEPTTAPTAPSNTQKPNGSSTTKPTENNSSKQTVTDNAFTGYVTSNHNLNVRSEPDAGATRLGSLERGTSVQVKGAVQVNGKNTGWYLIRYNGKDAYVSSQYVSKTKPEIKKEQTVKSLSFTGYATSKDPDLNVRTEPDVSAKRLGSLGYGTAVEVTGVVQLDGKDAGWYQIKYDGKTAYAASAFISKTKPSTVEVTVKDETFTGKVTASGLNVRAKPDAKADKLGAFSKGDSVSVTGIVQQGGKDTGWYRVTYKGKTGYVSAKYISKDTSSPTQTVTEVSFTGYVTTDTLTVYEKPDTSAKSLGTLKKNNVAEVTGTVQLDGKDTGWYRIRHNGGVGYVQSGSITKTQPEVVVPVKVSPKPQTINMQNLGNCTLPISLTAKDATVDSSGTMQLKVTVYAYDVYNKADITKLRVNDTIVLRGQEVTVTSLDRSDTGSVTINAGQSGGWTLSPDSSGDYAERLENDARYWQSLGTAIIRVSADFQFRDSAGAEEKTYTAAEFFAPDSGISWSFTPGNTSLTVKDGLAVSMIRVYTP